MSSGLETNYCPWVIQEMLCVFYLTIMSHFISYLQCQLLSNWCSSKQCIYYYQIFVNGWMLSITNICVLSTFCWSQYVKSKLFKMLIKKQNLVWSATLDFLVCCHFFLLSTPLIKYSPYGPALLQVKHSLSMLWALDALKGNVWVPMLSHSNASLIFTSEMWILEKLTTYFDI